MRRLATLQYERVKRHVLRGVAAGRWQAGARIQSEHELVRALQVSRMTANRAIRELVQAGVLYRIAGSGTFVTDHQSAAHPLQIRNIAADIRARGHAHRSRLLCRERIAPTALVRARLALPARQRQVFHSVVLHYENELPLQLEDRYVNPAVAPDYLEVDLERTTAHEHLTRVAPLARVEHVLRATRASPSVARNLAIGRGDAVLLIERTTWSRGVAASFALLHHPGERFELRGQFNPTTDESQRHEHLNAT